MVPVISNCLKIVWNSWNLLRFFWGSYWNFTGNFVWILLEIFVWFLFDFYLRGLLIGGKIRCLCRQTPTGTLIHPRHTSRRMCKTRSRPLTSSQLSTRANTQHTLLHSVTLFTEQCTQEYSFIASLLSLRQRLSSTLSLFFTLFFTLSTLTKYCE